MKTNLVVVAHPDDEILGFGASAAKLAEYGDRNVAVILSSGVAVRSNRPADDELLSDIMRANRLAGFDIPTLGSFPNLKMNQVGHVELVQFVEENIRKYKPNRIFTHHPSDLNDDHRVTSHACMAAFRLFQRDSRIAPISTLCLMEIPSATDWSIPTLGCPFEPDTFIDVSSTFDMKISALEAYRGVIRPTPHPRSREMLHSLHSLRGAQSGFLLAESFQTVFRRGI